jgi:hypothetical protein
MARPISTKEHGILDLLTVGTLTAVPRIFRWEDRVTSLLTGAAGGMLGYSLLTRYQMGLIKLLPMKAHLILDGMSSGLLLGAPFLLRKKSPGVIATLVGLGAMEITVALLTKTRPPLMVQMEPTLPQVLPEQLGENIQHRLAALRSR